MSEKNFVNYHVLVSHSPSCLNRDDMGLQKSAIFGGKKRVRISSQCIKRAIRKSDYYKEVLGEPSIRTKKLDDLLAKCIDKLGETYDVELISTIISEISGVSDIKEGEKSGAVAAWAVSEVEEYCSFYKKIKSEINDEKQLKKEWEKAIKNKKNSFNKNFTDGIDIALSGRMATSGIMTCVDASLAVAHALTTHVVDNDIDWFTAVDDLNVDPGDTGSAHLDTQEFSAGVFYKYASLNLQQLQENINDCNREQALEIAAHILNMFATVVPTGKQNSFAAFNPADFILLTIGNQPVSLINAFETPVVNERNGGLVKTSIISLNEYREKLFNGYDLNDQWACYSLSDAYSGENRKETLEELAKWLKGDGKDE